VARGSSTRSRDAVPSALDELLDAEREIAARATQVAAECEATLDAARAEAATIERDGVAALDRELTDARAAAAADREAAAGAIDAAADRQIHRYQSLSPAELERLAEVVAARVTGLNGAAAAAAGI
jgi:hypothetical protein